jgi:hypothetical protein
VRNKPAENDLPHTRWNHTGTMWKALIAVKAET